MKINCKVFSKLKNTLIIEVSLLLNVLNMLFLLFFFLSL